MKIELGVKRVSVERNTTVPRAHLVLTLKERYATTLTLPTYLDNLPSGLDWTKVSKVIIEFGDDEESSRDSLVSDQRT